ncbi:hypothetical protein FNZ56_04280 [Pseudoluteimonas lycopersici]|uniref:Prokaryotic metallothionein n=1 Tax=Pseudoluteimonas lycopersici TaxID=1324796 RepID=A0A516V3P5_9GAMM|nr:hypothetical protein FNZ56_04280 [Lysobacter lycopersici]
MGTCAVCGNSYDKTFVIRMAGIETEFDSFECAIHKLAPRCGHCACAIVGHGIGSDEKVYCCASCARMSGVNGAKDRLP